MFVAVVILGVALFASQGAACKKNCGVDGKFGKWSKWSKCSKECGGGVMVRTRQCDSPAPSEGGAPCKGKDRKQKKCNKKPCKEKVVDGGWSDWQPVGECSAKCGGGEITYTRTCDNPKPSGKGSDCEGPDSKTEKCNTDACEFVYTISHKTGTGTYADGAPSGMYLFTLTGTDGTVGPVNCGADRSKGVYSECSFKWRTDIGRIRSVTIKNTGDNYWAFSSFDVKIDGVLNGRWEAVSGVKELNDYKEISFPLTHVLDHNVSYKITHTTGTSTYYNGPSSGAYDFWLIGTLGETEAFDCDADRSKGSIGTCTIESNSELGKILRLRVKNKTRDMWVFTTFRVEVDGETAVNWTGVQKVPDLRTVYTDFL